MTSQTLGVKCDRCGYAYSVEIPVQCDLALSMTAFRKVVCIKCGDKKRQMLVESEIGEVKEVEQETQQELFA